MKKLELRCESRGHLAIERPDNLPPELEKSIISERICRDCGRRKSSGRIRRTVYHRWNLAGERLKDRTVRWDRQPDE